MTTKTNDIESRIQEYLSLGGLFNPELMEHNKVRDLIIDCRKEIANLKNKAAYLEWQYEELCK
jgi:hypothetical protein